MNEGTAKSASIIASLILSAERHTGGVAVYVRGEWHAIRFQDLKTMASFAAVVLPAATEERR